MARKHEVFPPTTPFSQVHYVFLFNIFGEQQTYTFL